MPGSVFSLEVNPRLPDRLSRLEELANDLWYSWDRPTRALFAKLDSVVWQTVGHSPKAFLKRIDERRLEAAAVDPVFVSNYLRVLSAFDTYHEGSAHPEALSVLPGNALVAYFCAEFGFHESLPIYSGGLGILAGDHCKAASDVRLPFVGVGLLYRQGYFHQSIDSHGLQQATYSDADFSDLPVTPVLDADGRELRVRVPMAEREVAIKVWQARVGHVRLFLLDADVAENTSADRGITHRLYGGDRTTRIEQEIILGVGGVRALGAMGLGPTVWHINEGHAAFMILERMRALVAEGADLRCALEATACNTVFTTHTAVPAGHDHFATEIVERYFQQWCARIGATPEELLSLGATPASSDFNMTALAIRGSRFQNGVSRIHGGVSSRICAPMWPQIPPEENPIDSITNGVHIPTFLSDEWAELFSRQLGSAWSLRPADPASWEGVLKISDQQFWSVRQSLKVADAAPGEAPHPERARTQPRLRGAPGSDPSARRPREPECADDRVRAALRHLQARDAAVRAPGLAARTGRRPRAAVAVRLRGQGASGRRAGPRTDPPRARGGVHARVRRQPAAGRGLRPAAGPKAGAGRGRLAEQPDLSARGLRNFRASRRP